MKKYPKITKSDVTIPIGWFDRLMEYAKYTREAMDKGSDFRHEVICLLGYVSSAEFIIKKPTPPGKQA